MPSRTEVPGVSVIRAFAAARSATTGVRATARAIGVRQSGLQYFLDGGKPHARTLRKLEDWYLQAAAEEVQGTGDVELVALQILLRGVPASKRADAIGRTATFYAELYEALGTTQPQWLKEARRLLTSE